MSEENEGVENESGKPDYVEAKFWDAESRTVKVEDMARSYGELQTTLGRKVNSFAESDTGFKTLMDNHLETVGTDMLAGIQAKFDEDRFVGRPESADKYELNIPEELIPENVTVTAREDHPMVQFWREAAFASGRTQEQFQEGVNAFIESELDQLPDYENEMKSLGENAQQRSEAINAWASKTLDDNQFASLERFMVTADNFKLIETLFVGSGQIKLADNTDAVKTDPVKTRDELKTLMNDERYHNSVARAKDPAYRQMVQKEWARAFPGQINLAAPARASG
jgi:uncharacterized Zn finger protein